MDARALGKSACAQAEKGLLNMADLTAHLEKQERAAAAAILFLAKTVA